jgi:trimeric autotransporter adhesin
MKQARFLLKVRKPQFLAAALLFSSWFTAMAAHAQITPLGDSYTNTADPTANYGAKTLLDVDGATQVSYIQFNLASIPSGASVSQATLKLYVNAVSTAGSFNVDYINGAWTESTIDAGNAPPLGTTIASNVDVTTADKNQYILINVTSAVQAWLDGSETNNGLALVANSTFNASFDSKENTGTSHPAELDIAYAGGDGTITGVTTASGSGLTGGGTSGTLNLSLTNACSSGQILQWSGSAWACATAGTGTVTSVATGTGLTGGPITSSGTISINTSVVPRLSAANTFTGNQTVNGDVSATGVVTGSSYQIGSNLFDYGSYANGNAFLGFAGNTTTTGANNTASGIQALAGNTIGGNNTASGFNALSYNTTGYNNTASGTFALYSNFTGPYNTAAGSFALYSNLTGSWNTASGSGALQRNTTGAYNTASGAEALGFNTTGPYNTATGYDALFENTTANYNTASGAEAMYSNTTGEANLADGALALYSNTTGAGNTAVGANACYYNTTGNYLTCFGYSSSSSDGISNATAIGAYARVERSNSLVLGGTGEHAVNVGIGTTKPSNILTIGRGLGHPVSDSWETYSSRRWKTNIKTLPDALSKVEQLRGVSYDLKDSGKHEVGVIAEEVGAVVPEVVTYEENGKDARGVDYSRLTALLIEAVKQQQREIAALRARLRKRAANDVLLESRLAQLERQSGEKLASVHTAGGSLR